MGKEEVAFGKALYDLRQQRGLSQEGMADLCNLDRTYISRLERGHTSPTLRTIDGILRRLNITLVELTSLMGKHGCR
jgi:transcriptional regulator with XRE-family HTH domain